MDVGSGKKIHEISPLKLGKRGMEEAYFEQDTKTERKGGKRGKYQEDILKNEAAGVQEHPCRPQ